MSNPQDHHHVPQFLLAGWCRGDGRLAVYTRRRERIVIDWHTPEHTGFERNLYAISALPDGDRQWVEREVMSKAVDGPASEVCKRLRAGELSKLNSDERSAWGRFIMAQWLRSPEMIAKLRRDGRAVLLQALEADPEQYAAVKGDAPEATLPEWVEANRQGLDEIVTMGRVLPKLINETESGTIIINMHWQVIHLDGSKVDLLIADRPAIRFEGLKSRNCMITVPLDPYRLFVASHFDRGFARVSAEKIARAANVSTAQAAHTRIYGSGAQHGPLVEKYLTVRDAAEARE